MKITTDTIETVVETWEDPGDYPSGAGSFALPSYKYIEGIDGELIIELTWKEYTEALLCDSLDQWLSEVVEYELPSGIISIKWGCEVVGGNRIWWTFWSKHRPVTLIFTAIEVEADPDYIIEDDGDYDDCYYD